MLNAPVALSLPLLVIASTLSQSTSFQVKLMAFKLLWDHVQENKESLLALTIGVGTSQGTGEYGDDFEELRNCGLHVLEAVERNGVVPPWTIVPPLLALITDPSK